MGKIIMLEDFTLCYEAIQKFLKCTGHAQAASCIIIDKLTFSQEYEEATEKFLSDLSLLFRSNEPLKITDLQSHTSSDDDLLNREIKCSLQKTSPLRKKREASPQYQLPNVMHVDINLKVLQEQVTEENLTFFKDKCLFFQWSFSNENRLLEKKRLLVLIFNTVDDESGFFSLFEKSGIEKLPPLKHFNVDHSEILGLDDLRKCFSNIYWTRPGSPVFGNMMYEGYHMSAEVSGNDMKIVNYINNDIILANANSLSDTFSFSKIGPPKKKKSIESKTKERFDSFDVKTHPEKFSKVMDVQMKSMPIPKEDLCCFEVRTYCDSKHSEFSRSSMILTENRQVIAERYLFKKVMYEKSHLLIIECYDQHCQQQVCIKLYENDRIPYIAFINEVKILRALQENKDANESYCVRLHDFFYYNGRYYIVQELLQYNLCEAIKLSITNNKCTLTLGKIQRIAYQVLKGLEELHALNILHCDLKPENILVENENPYKIKIIDFGNSLFEHDKNTDKIIQTIYYRAPEVVLQMPYNKKIDIWSLGCILAELWSGNPLFPCEEEISLLIHMVSTLGPFPFEMIQSSKLLSQSYFEKFLNLKKKLTGDQLWTTLHTVRVYKCPNFPLKNKLIIQDPNFLDFLLLLLQLQPSQRPDACEALKHAWLQPGLYPDGL